MNLDRKSVFKWHYLTPFLKGAILNCNLLKSECRMQQKINLIFSQYADNTRSYIHNYHLVKLLELLWSGVSHLPVCVHVIRGPRLLEGVQLELAGRHLAVAVIHLARGVPGGSIAYIYSYLLISTHIYSNIYTWWWWWWLARPPSSQQPPWPQPWPGPWRMTQTPSWKYCQ